MSSLMTTTSNVQWHCTLRDRDFELSVWAEGEGGGGGGVVQIRQFDIIIKIISKSGPNVQRCQNIHH